MLFYARTNSGKDQLHTAAGPAGRMETGTGHTRGFASVHCEGLWGNPASCPKGGQSQEPVGSPPGARLQLTCPCMSPGAQGARKQGCVAALSAALPAAHPPACPGRLCPVYSQDEPCTELGSQDQGPSRCPGPEASPRSPSAGGPRVPLVDKDTAAPRH